MSMMDEWTEIKSEADYQRVISDLKRNQEALKQERDRLQSIVGLTDDQIKTVTAPLEMMIERASLSIARWTSRSVGTLYQVQNKVFSITFWNKDEAEDFINKQCSTTNLHGFEIHPLEVFGDKEKWIRENVSHGMIIKEKNGPSIDCIRDPDAGMHGMGNVFGR